MLRNILKHLRNILEYKQWHTLSYHKLKLKFKINPRKGKCVICGKEGWTNIHHTCYNFTYKEVRANNELAKMFTYETCYPCHELSNSTRKLMFEDKIMEIKTNSIKVSRIVELHKKLLAKRDEWNEKHRKNGKIV